MVTVQSHLENAISVFKSGSLSAEVNAGKQVSNLRPEYVSTFAVRTWKSMRKKYMMDFYQ